MPEPTPVAAPAEPVETPPAEPAEETVDIDADLPEGQDTFERSYVEKLRSEAAARRTALKRYEAFNVLPDNDLDILSQVIAHINDPDPEKQRLGAEAFIAIGRDLLGDETPEETPPVQQPKPEDDNDDGPLTPAKVQELINAAIQADREERTQTEAKTQAQRDFDKKAKEAGFDKEADPYAYTALLKAMVDKGDFDKAVEAVTTWRQGIVDSFVNERQNDTQGATTPPGGGGAPGEPAPEKALTMKEARAKFRTMMQEAAAADTGAQ